MALVKISNYLMRDPQVQIAIRQKFPNQKLTCVDEKADADVHTYKIEIAGFQSDDAVKFNFVKHVNGNLIIDHIGPDSSTEANNRTITFRELYESMSKGYSKKIFQLDEFFKTLRYDLSNGTTPLTMDEVFELKLKKNTSQEYYDKFEIFTNDKKIKDHMITKQLYGKKYELVSKISDEVVTANSFRHDYFKLKSIINE